MKRAGILVIGLNFKRIFMIEAVGYEVKTIEQNGQYRFDFIKNSIEIDSILLVKNEVLQIKELVKGVK
jgi:hypothetical protein